MPLFNRNFITNTKLIDKNKRPYIKRTAQLDHFFPESEYPILRYQSITIPVCGVCNMILIGVNPYEISNSDEHLIFDYSPGKSISESNIDTVFMSTEFKKNWTELGLEALYDSRNSYLVDLLSESKYTVHYIEKIYQCTLINGVTGQVVKQIYPYLEKILTDLFMGIIIWIKI